MNSDVLIFIQTLIFMYGSFCAGDLLLRIGRISVASPLRRGAYAVSLGYVIFGLVGLILGIAGFFYAWYLRLFVLAVFFASAEVIRSHSIFLRDHIKNPFGVLRAIKNLYRTHTFLKIILTLWIPFNLFLAFVPVTGRDTLTFHLSAIMDIAQNGRITFSPDIDNFFPWSPLLGEIIYAGTAVLFQNISAPFVFQVVQWSTIVLLLALAYDFFRTHFKENMFLPFLPILTLSIFEIQREVMHGGYVDMLLLLFGIAALFPILDLWDKKITWDHKNIYLSALFMGGALGIKYNAFYFLAITALLLLGAFWYRGIRLRNAGKTLAVACFIILLLAGFWYGKNALWFGNPIYPMLGIDGSSVIGDTIAYERTITNFLLFPYNHFGSLSERDSSTKLIVFYHFLAIGALFLFLLAFDRKNIRLLSFLLTGFIFLFLGLIFLTSHHTRYFLGPLFLLPPLFLLLLDRFYEYGKTLMPASWHHAFSLFARAALIALAIFFFVGNVHYFYVKLLYRTGFLTEQEYIVEIGGQ